MELRDWIWESGIPEPKNWWNKLASQWKTLANYFTHRVTTALSEGVNKVIKSLKRQCYGFRNMEYFRLKILQRCGFLNSPTRVLSAGVSARRTVRSSSYGA